MRRRSRHRPYRTSWRRHRDRCRRCAARGTPRTPAELAQHDCLLLDSGSGPPNLWHFTSIDGEDVTVLVPARIRAFIDFLVERIGRDPPWEQRTQRD